MPGAPVEWCRKILPGGSARALVVNAGIANVFTGKAGKQAVTATADGTARALGCKATEVYLASTGVIGQVLPAVQPVANLPTMKAALSGDGWLAAAQAVLTPNTPPNPAPPQPQDTLG